MYPSRKHVTSEQLTSNRHCIQSDPVLDRNFPKMRIVSAAQSRIDWISAEVMDF